MVQNKSANDEIEESLRICEELMKEHADFVPEQPEFDWEEILGEIPVEQPTKPVQPVKPSQPTKPVQPIRPTQPVKPAQPIRPQQPERKAGPEVVAKEADVPKQEPEKAVKLTQPVKPPEAVKQPEAVKPPKAVKQKKGKDEREKERHPVRTVISLLICLIIAVAVALFITKFVANHTTVEGSSMEPTLTDGDNLVVEKISYMTGSPERFDIIVFRHSENDNYIKRIIGLPGERIRIEEGKIYINEKPIFDTYGDGSMTEGGIAEETVTLGNDEYFVMGDNRDGSEDSRDENVGPIKADTIVGRAWFRVTPFERFGILE